MAEESNASGVLVSFFKRPLWLVVLFCLGCSAQSLSPEVSQRIERQVRAHFKIPAAVSVSIGAPKSSEFKGYDSVPITIEGRGQKSTYDFLLSKDGRTLLRLNKIDISPEAYARTVEEDTALHHSQAELMKKIDVKGRPWRGAASPKISIVVYDDFECPYCASLYRTIFSESMKTYSDQVRIIFKDYPLFEIHPWARRAAIDSNCLAEQSNDAYWSFADYVHENQGEISGASRNVNAAFARLDDAAVEQARKFKADTNILQACLRAQPDAALKASVKEAESMGVSSTPTLFINGDKVEGAVPLDELRQAIETALRDASPTVASSSTSPPAAATPTSGK